MFLQICILVCHSVGPKKPNCIFPVFSNVCCEERKARCRLAWAVSSNFENNKVGCLYSIQIFLQQNLKSKITFHLFWNQFESFSFRLRFWNTFILFYLPQRIKKFYKSIHNSVHEYIFVGSTYLFLLIFLGYEAPAQCWGWMVIVGMIL